MRARRSLLLFCLLAAPGCTKSNTFEGSGTGSPPRAPVTLPDGGPRMPRPADWRPQAATPWTILHPGGPRTSPIAAENAQPGSRGWLLSNPTGHVEGFADRVSYLPGGQVVVHAAADQPDTVTWELWRLGYYGGQGGRLWLSGGPVALPAKTAPVLDTTTGEVRASWPAAFAFTLPASATTGVYLLKLKGNSGDGYVPLIVREAFPEAPMLAVLPTNTWQAYNKWGGTSLYVSTRADWKGHAHAVTYDRPYESGGAFRLYEWESFIFWAEGQGYDLGYAADPDLQADPNLALTAKVVTTVEHSEYWTREMRQHFDAAVAAGVSVAFLGANSAYWQVRFEPTAIGPNRRIVGYKEDAAKDPWNATDPSRVTTRFRDPPVNDPENGLVGIMFGSWVMTSSPLWTKDPGHWLWTGTGVDEHTLIAGIFGNEVDQQFDNGFAPAGLELVGQTEVDEYMGWVRPGALTVYRSPAGGWVLATGSIAWTHSLAQKGYWDPRVQQLTANFYSVALGDGALPAPLATLALPAGPPQPIYSGSASTSTVATGLSHPVAVAAAPNGDAIVVDGNKIVRVDATGTVSLIAGSDTHGDADGLGADAAFYAPRDVVVAADGTIYVADTGNQRIRKISAGQVTTLAGHYWGFADGTGTQAQFAAPTSLALLPNGDLVVTDVHNDRIREVTPAGVVTTLGGTGTIGIVDGPLKTAQFWYPFALTVMPDGSIVVAEADTGILRRITLGPTPAVSPFAGAAGRFGWGDGPLSSAQISNTSAMTALPNGDLVLLDAASSRLRLLTGTDVTTLVGGRLAGRADGIGGDAAFTRPHDVARAPDGSLLVVDLAEGTLRRVQLH